MKKNYPVSSSQWFPENLQNKEIEFRESKRKAVSSDDFGSYKIMLNSNDRKKSHIDAHNDLYPKIKLNMVKDFIEKRLHKNLVAKIFNLGCGLGHESKFLSDVFNSKVLGIDVSHDAIEYANKHNSNENTNFKRMLVDESFKLNDKFDIGFAFEFYPFTRTNDRDFQLKILGAMFNNLTNNGKIIIYHLFHNEESIKNNIDYLAKKLNKNYIISKRLHPKIYYYTKSFFITNILSFIYNVIFHKKDISRRIIVFY